MNRKQNRKRVNYLREISIEKNNINNELNNKLTELVRKGENLIEYELWINEKCNIFIQPIYIIDRVNKNLVKEGFKEDTVYAIVKKEFEEEIRKDEINRV